MMNKKADTLMENIVFILLVVVFSSVMFFAITKAGNQAAIYEQIYSKELSLIINKAKPGMEIELDIFDMYRIARKNNFDGNIINIINEENKINIKLSNGGGYNYFFLNDVDVAWNLKKDERKLILKIIERQKNN